eukprot:gene21986-biopygen30674
MDAGLSIRLVPVECSGSVGLFVSPPARQITDSQIEILELPVEQAELLACEVLFRSFYSCDLAEEVRIARANAQGEGASFVKLLVRVYRLADRLEVCTDQCAQAMSNLSLGDLESIDDTKFVFSLKRTAPALAEHAAIKVLMEKCLSELAECYFGSRSREIYWTSVPCWLERIKSFRRLEDPTVLAFLDFDDLDVTSENEVLTLMGVWIGKDWADRISKEQLGAFWNVLRVRHLTTSFISNLAEIVHWLPVDPAVLRHATEWKIYQAKDSGDAASMQEMLQSVHGTSVAWFKDKRKPTPGLTLLLFVDFVAADLAKLLTSVQHSGAQEDVHAISAPHEFFNGYDFFLTLSVQVVSDGSKKSFVLSLGVEFRTSALISQGIQTLVRVKGRVGFVLGPEHLKMHELGFLYGPPNWEFIRVDDTLDDFSFLGLDRNGNREVLVEIDSLD